MKKILFYIMCMVTLVTGNIYAQGIVTDPTTSFVIDLGTFTGIVALTSSLVTQIAKRIPAISLHKPAKIGVSVAVGVIVCMVSWALQLTPLLDGYVWWQVLIYGVAVGLSGCGFYDVVKAIGALFKAKETN